MKGAAEDVLAGLDFETPAQPTVMCEGRNARRVAPQVAVLVPCDSIALVVVTCGTCGAVIHLCATHRLHFQPADEVCGDTWFEAIL